MHHDIAAKLASYPNAVKHSLLALRALIFSSATELGIEAIDESIKWGQLSYRVKGGSPIRIGWQDETPHQYLLFFHCQTQLVDTFRQLYPNELVFQGNRAIVFSLSEPLSVAPTKHCISIALNYHKVKHLPLLGQ